MKRLQGAFYTLVLILLGQFHLFAQQYCWTISDADDRVYRFDYITGVTSTSYAVPSSAEASTLSHTGDTLFIMNYDDLYMMDLTAASPSALFIAHDDIDNGNIDGLWGTQNFSDYDALTMDSDGNIWAAAQTTGDRQYVVVINPSTGFVIQNYFGAGLDYLAISVPSKRVISCMAIDPLNGKLYANMSAGSGTVGTEDLYNIDIATGDTNLIATFPFSDFEGMGFSADGDMLVTSGSNGPAETNNRLFLINMTDATATELHALPGGDNETCDCVKNQNGVNEISGYVYWDEDYSGTFGAKDTSLKNHSVYLYDDTDGSGNYESGTDVLLSTTATNDNGYYYFRRAYSGSSEHFLIFSSASQLTGGNEYTTEHWQSATFNSSGNVDANNNFGFNITLPKNSISGKVFGDQNEDGIDNNNSEIGIENVYVHIYLDKNQNGIIDPGDDGVKKLETDKNGQYKFDVPFQGFNGSYRSRITSETDDVEESPGDNGYLLSNVELNLGDQYVGLRYTNLEIPQGAKILSAKVNFIARTSGTGLRGTFYGYNIADAPSFTNNTTAMVSGRSTTISSQSWRTASWIADTEYSSPDMSAIIQEIIDRPTWTNGNDISLLWHPTDGNNNAYAFDDEPMKSPELAITYVINDEYYIVQIDSNTKPAGSQMTTDIIESAHFTSGGNIDSLNNFGIWGGNALPVELISFTAEKFGKEVLLKWITASELNNHKFIVQRSFDGVEFEDIGKVMGRGTTNAISNYEFLDFEAKRGENYYRIKQLDFDGKIEYSELRLVLFEGYQKAEFIIYPNPNPSGVLSISLKKSFQLRIAHLDIYTQDGKIIESFELNPEDLKKGIKIDLSEMIPGAYSFKLSTNTNTFWSKFFRL